VGKFDHHCKWLNHCIGSRNYVAFLMCVVSAVVATLVIVAAVVAQIVFYYVQPEWLSFYWCPMDTSHPMEGGDYINLTLSLGNGTMMLLEQQPAVEEEDRQEFLDEELANITISTLPTLLENFTALIEASTTQSGTSLSNHTVTQPVLGGIGLNETIFLFLLGVLGLLAAVSAGLLLHLCFFHIYISFLGLTTYEYIRNHRQAQEAKSKQLLEGASSVGVPKMGAYTFRPPCPNHTIRPSRCQVASRCTVAPVPLIPASSHRRRWGKQSNPCACTAVPAPGSFTRVGKLSMCARCWRRLCRRFRWSRTRSVASIAAPALRPVPCSAGSAWPKDR